MPQDDTTVSAGNAEQAEEGLMRHPVQEEVVNTIGDNDRIGESVTTDIESTLSAADDGSGNGAAAAAAADGDTSETIYPTVMAQEEDVPSREQVLQVVRSVHRKRCGPLQTCLEKLGSRGIWIVSALATVLVLAALISLVVKLRGDNKLLGDNNESALATCATAMDCSDNEACALSSVDVTRAQKICCSSWIRSFYTDDWPYTRVLCANKPAGTVCGGLDGICASGLCNGGVCKTKALDFASCENSRDCQGGVCAFEMKEGSVQKLICCPEGPEGLSGSTNNQQCTNMPLGTLCGDNGNICASGICLNEKCAQDRLDSGRVCTRSNDCQSQTCARPDANVETALTCCESGKAVSDYTEDGVWASFCTDMPKGTYCHEIDSMCASGVCRDGYCTGGPLGANAPCTSSIDCESRSCARGVADYAASPVCCPNGNARTGRVKDGEGSRSAAVCTGLPKGTYCRENDSMCSSGLCIAGFCADSALDDNAPCTEAADCKNGTCAYSTANVSAPSICCPGGLRTSGRVVDDSSYYGYSSEYVCSNMPVGTFCNDIDDMCSSRLCINGYCALEKIDNNRTCASSSDCKSGACGRPLADYTFSPVCCGSGNTVSGSVKNGEGQQSVRLCTGMSRGTYCRENDSMCSSGLCIGGICADSTLGDYAPCTEAADCKNGACSYAFANASAPTICCPGGSRTYGDIVDANSYYDYSSNVCSNMPVDTFCNDIDNMCSSGLCINGYCALEKIDNNRTCTRSSDCKSGACGRPVADYTFSPVCCGSGSTMSGSVKNGEGQQSAQICTGLPKGTYCRENDSMCSSGLCIGGICADSALDDNAPCTEAADCKNGACSYAFANASAPTICCPGGSRTYGDIVDDNSYYDHSSYVCSDMPLGTFCNGIDTMCASGLCIADYCVEGRLDDHMTCQESTDCMNGTCASASADDSAGSICCPGGATTGYSYYRRKCADMPVGTFCDSDNNICASGLCVNQVCADDKLEALASCKASSDCKSKYCSLAYADVQAPFVCCPSGETTNGIVEGSSNMKTVCASMSIGTYCHGLHTMCASGSCINSTCSNSLEDYATCDEPEQCKSRTCARSAADFDASKICCPDGSTFGQILFGNGGNTYAEVCAGLANGTYCLSIDSMCQSKKCVDGVCAS